MKYLLIITTVLFSVWVLYGYLSVRSIEEPKHRVIKRADPFELRVYEPQLIASIEVRGAYREASSAGFRSLADYIFGDNQQGASISMTAPVLQIPPQRSSLSQPQQIAMTKPVVQQSRGEDHHVISFMMPARYTLQTLPKPRNERVKIRALPQRKVAVVRFSGVFSEERAHRERAKLIEWLRAEGLIKEGAEELPVGFSRYNPPGTPPFMNRHEVWIELSAKLSND